MSFEKKDLSFAAPHSTPVELYLRAHFLNHRIQRIEKNEESVLEIFFGESGERRLRMEFKDRSISFECEIPGKVKPFLSELRLGKLPEEGVLEQSKQQIDLDSRQEKKFKRLLENVRSDHQKAMDISKQLSGICEKLKSEPQQIVVKGFWPQSDQQLLEEFFLRFKFSPWNRSSTKGALDAFFNYLQKQNRKVQLSAKRLLDLEKGGFEKWSRSQKKFSDPKESKDKSKLSPDLRTKKPGLWVEIEENIWARVGKSAKENDELMRQAASNDLWFHARGVEGAHVWLPRGQKGISSKGKVSPHLLDLVAQLAVLNSKYRSSGGGHVDVSEKKDLKKVKGVDGAVRIMRSEVRYVSVDGEFERKIFRK
ncbi:DUF814 domain-containing protein [bacterium]|nr:DUF814 domain-containing protein [bacterium]